MSSSDSGYRSDGGSSRSGERAAGEYLFAGGSVGRPVEELEAACRRRRETLERLGDSDAVALVEEAYAVAREALTATTGAPASNAADPSGSPATGSSATGSEEIGLSETGTEGGSPC